MATLPKKRQARPTNAKPRRQAAAPGTWSDFRRRLHLTQSDSSRLLGISLRSVAAMEAETASVPMTRRVAEIRRLCEEGLMKIMREEAIGPWLAAPNSAFGGFKPLEIIERGEVDRIWGMIHGVESGEPM